VARSVGPLEGDTVLSPERLGNDKPEGLPSQGMERAGEYKPFSNRD
jgi:hypothetical protein